MGIHPTKDPSPTSVDNTIWGGNTRTVDIAMSALDVGENTNRPRGLIWTADPVPSTPSVDSTYHRKAFGRVPEEDSTHVYVTETIGKFPQLFAVVTPIKADRLSMLLAEHPNQRLVESVVRGFKEGFWPGANAGMLFLRTQRDIEIGLGRFSTLFGARLLPGMVAQPVFMNSTIPAEEGTFRPDNLSDLGAFLIAYVRKVGRPPAWLFKSNASSAYRRLPCHPRWQVRQATRIDGEYHIDRCCVFGNRASGAIWCTFYALVLWIGIHVKSLPGLLHYVDDAFSFDPVEELEYYQPYDSWFPPKQVALLSDYWAVSRPSSKARHTDMHYERGSSYWDTVTGR